MHVSIAGRQMIERFEGCKLEAYQDIVGVWTIGYGCTGPDIGDGVTITQDEADAMLSDRLAQEFEPAVEKLAGAKTTQGQFDAMVCLAFNIGARAFSHSHVLSHHVAGEWQDAADAFLMWDKAGGREIEALERRREAEAQVYLDASPVAAEPAPADFKALLAPAPPATSDSLGHQKAMSAMVVPPAVSLAAAAAQAHGIDVTAHTADIAGLLGGLLVWLTPHGR